MAVGKGATSRKVARVGLVWAGERESGTAGRRRGVGEATRLAGGGAAGVGQGTGASGDAAISGGRGSSRVGGWMSGSPSLDYILRYTAAHWLGQLTPRKAQLTTRRYSPICQTSKAGTAMTTSRARLSSDSASAVAGGRPTSGPIST